MRKGINKEFFLDFQAIAKDIKFYNAMNEKQENDKLIKLTRHACLYKILEYHEYASAIFESKMEDDKIYIAGGYPAKLEHYFRAGLLDKDTKNTLLIVCNSRNRLVHDTAISLVEKVRLENKLMLYFKDEWFMKLIKTLYENNKNMKRMEVV